MFFFDYSKTQATKPNPPRGPLTGNWQQTEPVMTVYKLITAEFKWFGLQGQVRMLRFTYVM